MNFNDYKYERVEIEPVKKQFHELIEKFKNSSTVDGQCKYMNEIISLRNHIDTMTTLVSIRHSIDTTDKFYDEENEYCDEINPILFGFVTDFYKALTTSKFRAELEKKYGKFLFNLAECSLKTFNENIIPDLQEENKLSSKYDKLIASAKILFDGEERNLSQMVPYTQSKDRNIRKNAAKKVAEFFAENRDEFDNIYDSLVKVRTEIAKKLGFKNFVELAYARLSRLEYNPEMVASYRKQVYDNIVPLHSELRNRQAKRLGLDKLNFYDEPIKFNSGNANPHGEPEWILNHGKTMYHELSKETDEFFTFMTENNLLDLLSKKGKMSGGYCTYIPNYKSPFIFANFNGTAHDVDVLTHEAGHAFQVYESRKYEIPEYLWPSYEACEIHSMSMEFLTWPWMNLFFENDTDKYKFIHLSEALLFIPYGVTVDEFQHWVYENPEVTPEERRKKWIETEKKYLPTRNYGEIEELKEGIFWFRQGHIFGSPFYYIDYTLAQVCAFQFWIKSRENREKAWEKYLHLCRLGGSKPFLELLKEVDLKNPFIDGTIASIIPEIRKFLDNIDDMKL
ncbi:M3 family oligoendopeptidase [Leptotrichia sp. OH3620_COT-345]|uniref:M3 family oligoendopeptidase n=1 Tax=Leptotrichia sp. OH3620_COT-345 TaxID=2491048 RepID=UPI000F64C0A1|nr:M3 family oligoendopeptidase [Leptotrichia sp. OH3620_COT-345]